MLAENLLTIVFDDTGETLLGKISVLRMMRIVRLSGQHKYYTPEITNNEHPFENATDNPLDNSSKHPLDKVNILCILPLASELPLEKAT